MKLNTLQLGDYITRGNIDSKSGMTIGKKVPLSYRVIRINPKIKIQRVFWVKGFQELGEIEEWDYGNLMSNLRQMFPPGHLVHLLSEGEDWSMYWVGNF